VKTFQKGDRNKKQQKRTPYEGNSTARDEFTSTSAAMRDGYRYNARSDIPRDSATIGRVALVDIARAMYADRADTMPDDISLSASSSGST
jgi:hypothetical protein